MRIIAQKRAQLLAGVDPFVSEVISETYSASYAEASSSVCGICKNKKILLSVIIHLSSFLPLPHCSDPLGQMMILLNTIKSSSTSQSGSFHPP